MTAANRSLVSSSSSHVKQNQLLSASKQGKVEEVRRLLKLGEPVTQQDHKGNTALHCASKRGHYAVVQLLVQNGAPVDFLNQSGQSPMELSTQPEITKLLALAVVQKKEAPSLLLSKKQIFLESTKSSSSSHYPLHLAAKGGNSKELLRLLELGRKVDERDGQGNTPLHLASMHGRLSTVKLLIEKGASIEARNASKETPLDLAKCWGQSEVLSFFLKKSPSPQLKNKSLGSAFLVQNKNSLSDQIQKSIILSEIGLFSSNLKSFSSSSIHKKPDFLTVKSSSSSSRGKSNKNLTSNCLCSPGDSPLHKAIRSGECSQIQSDIASGARLDQANLEGQTPVTLAIEFGLGAVVIWPIANHSSAPLQFDQSIDSPITLQITNQNKKCKSYLENTNSRIERLAKKTDLLKFEVASISQERKRLQSWGSKLVAQTSELSVLIDTNNCHLDVLNQKVKEGTNSINDLVEMVGAISKNTQFGKRIERIQNEIAEMRRAEAQLAVRSEKLKSLQAGLSRLAKESSASLKGINEKLGWNVQRLGLSARLLEERGQRLKRLKAELKLKEGELQRYVQRRAKLKKRIAEAEQKRNHFSNVVEGHVALDHNPDKIFDSGHSWLYTADTSRYRQASEELAKEAKELSVKVRQCSTEIAELHRKISRLADPPAQIVAKPYPDQPLPYRSTFVDVAKIDANEEKVYSSLLKAYEESRTDQMLLCLERLVGGAVRQGKHTLAAHLLNAALVCAHRSGAHPGYELAALERLEQLEAAFVLSQWGVTLPPTHRGSIRRNRLRLSRLRVEAQSMIDREASGRHVVSFLSRNCSDLLAHLIEETMEVLGFEPRRGGWAVGSLGSMARSEMCPFSDVELFFLIESSKGELSEFFQKCAKFLNFRIINLGETPFPLIGSVGSDGSKRSNATITPGGFCIDSGILSIAMPVNFPHLIGTPRHLANLQSTSSDPIIVNAMRTVEFVGGDHSLFSQYQVNIFAGFAVKKSDFSLRRKRAIALMKRDVVEFKPNLSLNDRLEHRGFGIKAELYRLLQSIVSALALFHGVFETETDQQIALLTRKKIFTKGGGKNLQEVLSLILFLRSKVHLFYGYESDVIYRPENSDEEKDFFHITDLIAKQIARCYATLIPLHTAALSFMRGSAQAFSKSDLYDSSIERRTAWRTPTMGGLLSHLKQPKSWIDKGKLKQLEQQVALDPNNTQARREYACALYDQGKWREAIGHYEATARLLKKKQRPALLLQVLQDQGRIWYDIERYHKAISLFKECVSIGANLEKSMVLPSIRADLARAFLAAGMLDEASIQLDCAASEQLKCFGKGLRYASILLLMGDLYRLKRKEKEATRSYKEGLCSLKSVRTVLLQPSAQAECAQVEAALHEKLGAKKKAIIAIEGALFVVIRMEGSAAYPAHCTLLERVIALDKEMSRRSLWKQILASYLFHVYGDWKHPKVVASLKSTDTRVPRVWSLRRCVKEIFCLLHRGSYLCSPAAGSISSGNSLSVGGFGMILNLFERADQELKSNQYQLAAVHLGRASYLIGGLWDDGPGLGIALDWQMDEVERHFFKHIGLKRGQRSFSQRGWARQVPKMALNQKSQRQFLEKLVSEATQFVGASPVRFKVQARFDSKSKWSLAFCRPPTQNPCFERLEKVFDLWLALSGCAPIHRKGESAFVVKRFAPSQLLSGGSPIQLKWN